MANETKNTQTELVFILDKSGSMAGLESDTVGGFNAMIEKQRREPGGAWVTTVLFSSESETLHDRLPLEAIPPMTEKEYAVGGCTALIDAIGETVRHIEKIHKYARKEDVPARTLFVITTDGMENASHRFTSDEVKKTILAKKEEGWEFLFLGANIDAVETAARFGIERERAATYRCDAAGTALNFEAVSCAISDLRNSKPIGKGWKKAVEDYEQNGKK